MIGLALGVALAVIEAALLGLCYYALVAIGQAAASPRRPRGRRSVAPMAAQMWRVVALYRVITLAYAAALTVRDHGRPGERRRR